jgi:chemotaxis protein MotA
MKRHLDLSTFVCITATIAMITFAINLSGTLKAFFDAPSLLIVVISTILITIGSFGFKDFYKGVKNAFSLSSYKPTSYKINLEFLMTVIETIYKYKGSDPKYLEKIVDNYQDNKFLHSGLMLIVDNQSDTFIEKVMEQEINTEHNNNMTSVSVLKKASEVAPSMGLVGTLIGLVQMLGSLSDIKMLGPSMAVALITTFYGAILSYVIIFPIAAKIEKISEEEITNMELIKLTILAIKLNYHPIHAEEYLNSKITKEHKTNRFKHIS